VDGIGPRLAGDIKNPIDIEVGLGRRGRTDVPRLIGEVDVDGISVQFGVDGDRTETEIVSGANYADGDLAPVRDENGFHDGILGVGRAMPLLRSAAGRTGRTGRTGRKDEVSPLLVSEWRSRSRSAW
jgi:hypothetical protein